MFAHLHDAVRRRIARGEDSGYALIFVMLMTMLIMAGVGTMLTVVASNVMPAKHSQDSETALAAAQAGIESYVAFLNGNCQTFGSTACSSINGTPVTGVKVGGADGSGTATYDRQVLNAGTYLSDGFLRVRSTGHAATGTKTLVADLEMVPSLLRFAYYSKYETQSGNYLSNYLPLGRTIALDNATSEAMAGGASTPCPGSTASVCVSWTTSPYDTSICNQLYYTPTTGRAAMKLNRPALPLGTDFSQSSSAGTLYEPCEVTFNSSMSFNGPVYTEDAPYLSYGNNGSTAGPTFTVPSKEDLPPVSTAYSGNAPFYYRQFPIIGGGPSSSSTGYATNATVQYRSYPIELPSSVDPSTLGKPCIFVGPTRVLLDGGVATVTSPLTTLPPPASADSSCYTNTNSSGQYLVNYTTSGSGVIYVENQTGSDATKYTGQTPKATASAANTAFYLTNGGAATSPDPSTAVPTVWSQAGQNAQTWQVYNPSQNCWAVSRNPNTPNGPKPWEEQTFQCDWFNQMGNKNYTPAVAPNDGYTAYQTALGADLAKTSAITIAGNPGNSVSYTIGTGSQQSKTIDCSSAANTSFVPVSASADQLVCLIQHDLRQANTGNNEANWANPSPSNYTHQYIVTGYTQKSSTQQNQTVGSTPSIDVGGDKFFDSTTQAGTPSTEDVTTTTTTFNIASQVFMCYGVSVGSLCLLGTNVIGNQWGDGTTAGASSPQFQVTVSQKTYSNFKQGTTAAAYFPSMSDVTQYHSAASGMGDAYVEGTGISGKLSLVAQNDVIVTGNLTTSSGTPVADPFTGEPSWSSGGAVDLIANGNVRIYHPVACADTTTTNPTAGFCPNDVTGLYDTTNPPSSIMNSDGTLGTSHPSLQYCDMTAGAVDSTGNCSGSSTPPATGSGPVSEIDAAIFALNSSFLTDNYDRGTGMPAPATGTKVCSNSAVATTSLTVCGGVYQVHRGATGEYWSSPATVNSSPPYSGYRMSIQYRNLLPANLPFVPPTTTSGSSDVWSVVSTSSGSGP